MERAERRVGAELGDARDGAVADAVDRVPEQVLQVRITWPSGLEQVLNNLAVDQALTVAEGF